MTQTMQEWKAYKHIHVQLKHSTRVDLLKACAHKTLNFLEIESLKEPCKNRKGV